MSSTGNHDAEAPVGRIATIIGLLAVAGCAPRGPDPKSAGLVAVVSPGSGPDTVVVEYRNGTAAEAVIGEQVLATNVLALEVTDGSGKRMPPVPPAVPWERDAGVRIPAGGSRRVEYSLQMFDPPLPAGRYRVRVRIDGWACEPLEYTVKEGR
jgi:hypothetical protein